MLRERRNCLRGRINGFEVRRAWLVIGDPLRTLFIADTPPNLARIVGIGGQGLLALDGRRSWGGESWKHSLNDMEEDVEETDDPSSPPNRKGGNWFSDCNRLDMLPIE